MTASIIFDIAVDGDSIDDIFTRLRARIDRMTLTPPEVPHDGALRWEAYEPVGYSIASFIRVDLYGTPVPSDAKRPSKE